MPVDRVGKTLGSSAAAFQQLLKENVGLDLGGLIQARTDNMASWAILTMNNFGHPADLNSLLLFFRFWNSF